MRLWTLHPRYLDAKGLGALWRESLLAQAVLAGRTRGYQHHPQLERFAGCRQPLGAIGRYLSIIAQEASTRGYSYDTGRIITLGRPTPIPVGSGQVQYERSHLLAKLLVRDHDRHMALTRVDQPDVHDIFTIIDGPIASWERPG